MTTETLPEVRPLEPTTPIRPSEAIWLGCLGTEPQIGGWGGGRYACVNRAMFIGWGEKDDDFPQYMHVDRRVPVLEPPCGWRCFDVEAGLDRRTASWVLIHLNDFHEWTRPAIADWLAEQGL